MDILLTKGREGMRLPASLIYLPIQKQTLDKVINDLNFQLQVLAMGTTDIVNDETISGDHAYSNQKVNQLLAQVGENLVDLNNTIQAEINDIYTYINALIYQQPAITSLELSDSDQIKVMLSNFINNADLSDAIDNFAVAINGSPLIISTITQDAGSTINLAQGTLNGISEDSGQITLGGW